MGAELAIIDHTARAHSTVVGGSSAGRERLLDNRLTPEMPPEELHDWLVYEPDTGLLRWRRVNNWRLHVGDVVGSLNDEGYVKFKINRVSYAASRAIWAMVYGYWPDFLVDHEDNDRANNRLKNLRPSTNQENCRNGKTRRDGLKGATWNKLESCWMAQIRWDKKNLHLGKFSTEEEAHDAYCAAALRLYGKFARFE